MSLTRLHRNAALGMLAFDGVLYSMMALNGSGDAAAVEHWPTADIVYVALVGTVMIAAFAEWILFLAAFLYCLVKVFQKADDLSTRLLAVLLMLVFTALRAIFLPVMIVTLPLPARITQHFPAAMVSFLQWFAFWTFAGLLTVPWLFCVYRLVTHSLGRERRIESGLDESTAPKVVVVMPCYKEVPEVLVTAVDSVVDCDYPSACIHVFLSFDGEQEDELYLRTIEKLGVPLLLDSYPASIDVVYHQTRVTVSRFPHGGKRSCQKRTYRLIDRVYAEYLQRHDDLFILFIDSDCILDRVCIQNFVYEMELKPGSPKSMLAMTGVITSTTEKNTLITLLQDMEYVHGQLFERSVESGCGAVTCLPGALTILRFSAFRAMAKYYFADQAEQCDDLFDYGKCHLGEDRWLTHLFMVGAPARYQIGMCTGAFCKTEAVQSFGSLLKQRRRWFLGYITNEACMLTDARLWRKYPLLCLMRLAQNTIRTTALLFFIMVLSIVTTSNKVANLPVGFIAVSLGLNWLLMFYFGLRLRRYKVLLYPLMFVVNPFFNWLYMVYGILTAGQRTWGGPRADAGAADHATTVQQAIARAEATGDDLNVVPESFRPAAAAAAADEPARRMPSMRLQPSRHVVDRFAAPAEPRSAEASRCTSPEGAAAADETSQPAAAAAAAAAAAELELIGRRGREAGDRDSVESFATTDNSVVMPHPIESLFAAAYTPSARAMQKRPAREAGPGGLGSVVPPPTHEPSTTDGRSDRRTEAAYLGLPRSDSPGRPSKQTTVGDGSGTKTAATSRIDGEVGPAPAAGAGPRGLPSRRRSMASRIARSPLAYLTFSRTSSSTRSSLEMDDRQERGLMGMDGPASPSVAPAEKTTEGASRRRKRLTKPAPKRRS